jgi:hypothetical protein
MKLTNALIESDPIAMMQRSEYGKMLDDIQHNLNVIKGEVYSLIATEKKKAVSISRKCLSNIRTIAFNLRKLLQAHKKAMPIRKLKQKEKKNA